MLGTAVAPSRVWRLIFGCGAWFAALVVVSLLPQAASIDMVARVAIALGATILAFGLAWTPVRRWLGPTLGSAPSSASETARPAQRTTSDAPSLSASFTEMVQLVTLDKNDTFHGTLEPKDFQTTMVLVQVVVRNDGSPSIADDWSMWLTVNGQDIKATAFPAPDFTFRPDPSGAAISYTQSEAIYNVGVIRPITKEMPIRGFMMGRFELPINVVADNLGTLRLRFADSRGTSYESVRKVRGKLRPGAEFVPGIGRIVP